MKAYCNGKLLWSDIKVASGPIGRFCGLMGRRELVEGEGLLLMPCRRAHTIFVRNAIDILYLSGDKRVMRIITLKPGALGPGITGAEYVLEVAAGSAHNLQVVQGDIIVFE